MINRVLRVRIRIRRALAVPRGRCCLSRFELLIDVVRQPRFERAWVAPRLVSLELFEVFADGSLPRFEFRVTLGEFFGRLESFRQPFGTSPCVGVRTVAVTISVAVLGLGIDTT